MDQPARTGACYSCSLAPQPRGWTECISVDQQDAGQRPAAQHAPHRWAIGYTFEHTIYLPGPANRGGGQPKREKRAEAGKAPIKATSKAKKPKQTIAPDPAQAEATRQERDD